MTSCTLAGSDVELPVLDTLQLDFQLEPDESVWLALSWIRASGPLTTEPAWIMAESVRVSGTTASPYRLDIRNPPPARARFDAQAINDDPEFAGQSVAFGLITLHDIDEPPTWEGQDPFGPLEANGVLESQVLVYWTGSPQEHAFGAEGVLQPGLNWLDDGALVSPKDSIVPDWVTPDEPALASCNVRSNDPAVFDDAEDPAFDQFRFLEEETQPICAPETCGLEYSDTHLACPARTLGVLCESCVRIRFIITDELDPPADWPCRLDGVECEMGEGPSCTSNIRYTCEPMGNQHRWVNQGRCTPSEGCCPEECSL